VKDFPLCARAMFWVKIDDDYVSWIYIISCGVMKATQTFLSGRIALGSDFFFHPRLCWFWPWKMRRVNCLWLRSTNTPTAETLRWRNVIPTADSQGINITFFFSFEAPKKKARKVWEKSFCQRKIVHLSMCFSMYGTRKH
jgi:hypothetical protein